MLAHDPISTLVWWANRVHESDFPMHDLRGRENKTSDAISCSTLNGHWPAESLPAHQVIPNDSMWTLRGVVGDKLARTVGHYIQAKATSKKPTCNIWLTANIWLPWHKKRSAYGLGWGLGYFRLFRHSNSLRVGQRCPQITRKQNFLAQNTSTYWRLLGDTWKMLAETRNSGNNAASGTNSFTANVADLKIGHFQLNNDDLARTSMYICSDYYRPGSIPLTKSG